MSNTVVLLMSGGLDSTVLACDLLKQGKNVRALYFDYGQQSSYKEWGSCLNTEAQIYDIERFEVTKIKIPPIAQGEDGYFPMRNLVFASLASSFAQSNDIQDIYIGLLDYTEGNVHYFDADSTFVKDVNRVFKSFNLKLHSPYINLRKVDIYRKTEEFNIDVNALWSCDFPVAIKGTSDFKRCGECLDCRNLEFYNAYGVPEKKSLIDKMIAKIF